MTHKKCKLVYNIYLKVCYFITSKIVTYVAMFKSFPFK